MALTEWAARWRIPPAAVADLRRLMGVATDPQTPPPPPGSEASVVTAMRLQASQRGGRLWRNNVGVAWDRRGQPVRFGLANDSALLNKNIKSSDLIGIQPVTIGPGDIGRVIGQFVSAECKRPGWKYSGTARERSQLAWIELIVSLGGDAFFVDSPDNRS